MSKSASWPRQKGRTFIRTSCGIAAIYDPRDGVLLPIHLHVEFLFLKNLTLEQAKAELRARKINYNTDRNPQISQEGWGKLHRRKGFRPKVKFYTSDPFLRQDLNILDEVVRNGTSDLRRDALNLSKLFRRRAVRARNDPPATGVHHPRDISSPGIQQPQSLATS